MGGEFMEGLDIDTGPSLWGRLPGDRIHKDQQLLFGRLTPTDDKPQADREIIEVPEIEEKSPDYAKIRQDASRQWSDRVIGIDPQNRI